MMLSAFRCRPPFRLMLILLASVLNAPPGFAQDAVAPLSARVTAEQRLPDSVSALIWIPDASALQSRLAACSLGRLVQDEAIGDVRNAALARLRQTLTSSPLMPPGISLDDWLTHLSGEVAVAVLPPGDVPVPLVLLVELNPDRDAIDGLIDRVIESAGRTGWKPSAIEIPAGDGRPAVPARLLTRERNARGAGPPATHQFAILKTATHLIVSNSVPTISGLLNRWDGRRSGSLAERENWRRIRTQLGTSERLAGLYWFVDPLKLTASGSGATNPARAALDQLGLSGLNGVGGAFDFATPEFDTLTQAVAVVDGPASGPFERLRLASNPLQLPRWVPDSAATAIVLNLDLRASWKAMKQPVEPDSAPSASSLFVSAVEATAERLKLNLNDDVLPQFAGPVTVLRKPLPGPDAKSAGRSAIVLAVEVLDVEKARQLLERLASEPDSVLTRRSSGATPVYSVAVSGGGVVEIAVAHGNVLVSNNRDLTDDTLASQPDAPRLLNDPAIEQLQAVAPDDVALLGTQRTAEQFRLLYELLRNRETGLPPFEQIASYFRPSASWLRVSDGVVEYVNVTLPPKKP